MARPSIILIEYRGKRWLLSELAAMTGIPCATIRKRLSDSWSLDQALGSPTPKQRRRGVVSNLSAFEGTGGGSAAHEISDISFSDQKAPTA